MKVTFSSMFFHLISLPVNQSIPDTEINTWNGHKVAYVFNITGRPEGMLQYYPNSSTHLKVPCQKMSIIKSAPVKTSKGRKAIERKLRDPIKTGRPSVLLLTRHAFTVNPCCEYGEERQVTGNKTINDNLLQEAGACVVYLALISIYFFSFFFPSIKWQGQAATESNVRNGKFWTTRMSNGLQQIHILWMTSACRRNIIT